LLKIFFNELFFISIMITCASQAFAVCTSEECKTAVKVYQAQTLIAGLNSSLFQLEAHRVNQDNFFAICRGFQNLSESLNYYNKFISESLTKSRSGEMSEKEKGLLIPIVARLVNCENSVFQQLYSLGAVSDSDFLKVDDDKIRILQDQRQRISQASADLDNF
jgi:hypothetical protein